MKMFHCIVCLFLSLAAFCQQDGQPVITSNYDGITAKYAVVKDGNAESIAVRFKNTNNKNAVVVLGVKNTNGRIVRKVLTVQSNSTLMENLGKAVSISVASDFIQDDQKAVDVDFDKITARETIAMEAGLLFKQEKREAIKVTDEITLEDPAHTLENKSDLSGVNIRIKMITKDDGTVRTCLVEIHNTSKINDALIGFNIDDLKQEKNYAVASGQKLNLNLGSLKEIEYWVLTYEKGEKEEDESYINKVKNWIREKVTVEKGSIKSNGPQPCMCVRG